MTSSEKKSFWGFLGLYIGSSVFLILFIAVSFYRFELSNMVAMKKEKMQNTALAISSKIISSYMHSQPLHVDDVNGYEITLYNDEKMPIYGNEVKGVEFAQGFYEDNMSYYFVDLSPQMHHGVKYLVLKSKKTDEQASELLKNILFAALFCVIVVAVVGYFLAKMFLKPIQNERLKLDKFIKDSTHELNTPISAILMSIERLKKESIDPKILQRVDISAKRVQKIYSDLTYLLLEDEKRHIKKVNLKEVLENELTLYEELARKKSLRIKKELDDVLFEIDETSAQRLFSNLLSNAIKYNAQGGEINIELSPHRFSMANGGAGIDKAHREKVFERFYRVSEHEGGFGIGLDIVKRVCERYNIDVEIDSKNDMTVITLKF